jgi:hypothetical protein
LAYRGGINVEIIEATDIPSLYRDYLPSQGQTMRLHHLGFTVDDLQATQTRLDQGGYATPFVMTGTDFANFAYADARAEVGHYLEYVQIMPAGLKFWQSIPGFAGLP